MINRPVTDDLRKIKRSFSTRRVPLGDMLTLIDDLDSIPMPGDLVLARVTGLGQHKRIEQPDGRRAQLYVGDQIIVCYGHRYAPDQFESAVPDDLGPCHLVAAGGIASVALSWHRRIKGPTEIEPIGLIGDSNGNPLNLANYALPTTPTPIDQVPVIIVAGESMNAGKSTAASALIHGLHLAGHKVGAIKATGTGAGGDIWMMHDAGAASVTDFTDAGFASTFKVPLKQLEPSIERQIGHALNVGCTAIVMELADGIFQDETSALLLGMMLKKLDAGMIFACAASLSGHHGVEWLRAAGHEVVGMSGAITQSPLAVREVENATGLDCYNTKALSTPNIATSILERTTHDRRFEWITHDVNVEVTTRHFSSFESVETSLAS